MVNTRKIKARMMELGLEQDTVAEAIGINVATFNLKLNNKRRFYLDEIYKLYQVLQLTTLNQSLDYFLFLPEICEKANKQ